MKSTSCNMKTDFKPRESKRSVTVNGVVIEHLYTLLVSCNVTLTYLVIFNGFMFNIRLCKRNERPIRIKTLKTLYKQSEKWQ